MRRFAAILYLVLGLALAGGAGAQSAGSGGGPDFEEWESVATLAETQLSDRSADTDTLIELREELAGWRSRLLNAEAANRERVGTLRTQLEALGPAPNTDAGESEPDAIATRRSDLNQRLREEDAPRMRATEAYNRANGLIGEIDGIVRDRQTKALLQAVPSPLNPVNWPSAALAVRSIVRDVADEIQKSMASKQVTQEIVRRSPLTLTLTVIGLLFLIRGRSWTTRLTNWVQSRRQHRGRLALGFLTSITQVVLPLVGITLLIAAFQTLRIAGTEGQVLIGSLADVAAIVFGTLWLVNRVFPRDDEVPTLLGLGMGHRKGLRRFGILIGCLLAVWQIINKTSGFDPVTPTDTAVLSLPVYVALGFAFWRFGRLLKRAVAEASEEPSVQGFAPWLAGTLGRLLIALAMIGPIAAMAGFDTLAKSIMIPAGSTLWLIGLFVAMQWPIRDVYAWIVREDVEKASQALIPVLIDIALILGALPLLLLIWGMRPEQLSELYTQFEEGVKLGETRVSPGDILTVLAVFALGYMATKLIQRALKATVLPRTRLDFGAQNAVSSFVGYTGIGLAALLAVTVGGIDLTALAVVFGALSVGIGFGLQNVVQNFIAGIILLIERPISEGDWIEVGTNMGIVKDISVRSTTIETFDRQQVIVPNADFISGTVTNWTRGSQIGRAIVNVGVAYGTDTRRVSEVLLEIARAHPGVAAFPEPGVDFMEFGASSLDFRVRMILRDVNTIVAIQSEIRHQIAERFAEEEIEIPFAQRDIWLRNPEALAGIKPAAVAKDDSVEEAS